MNCKPNDMAMVVKKSGAYAENAHTGERISIPHMGSVVHVVAHDGACWRLADPLPFKAVFSDGNYLTCDVVGIADELLKPMPRLLGADEIAARSPLAKVCDPQPVVVGAPAHGEVG